MEGIYSKGKEEKVEQINQINHEKEKIVLYYVIYISNMFIYSRIV